MFRKRDQLINTAVWASLTVGSIGLITASLTHWASLDITEVLGFVSGAFCVWLTVKENIWNWPVGIANSVFFVILFWRAHLFADMGLNVLYVILGFLGWYWWLRGGEHQQALNVHKASMRVWVWTLIATVLFTIGMTAFLRSVHDFAPFLDALTTALSLSAQYLLTRKIIENWHFWIAADVIYVGLYFQKGLPLTGVLYAIFLVMAITGLLRWRQTHRAQITAPEPMIETLAS